MKRRLSFLCAVLMALSLCACGHEKAPAETEPETWVQTVTVTFPEGMTADAIARKLEQNGVCSAAAFLQAAGSADTAAYPFLASVDEPDSRFRLLEGYLYPDTYEFYLDEDAGSVLARFLDNFAVKWTDEYAARAAELGESVDDVLTLASVIQGEAGSREQMATVSGILRNRLADADNFPYLQCDSTSEYVTDVIKPSAENEAAYRAAYDTYDAARPGLPVGPICNPGDDAIRAALWPETSEYIYFRHDKTGKIYYAKTLEEHEQNGLLVEQVNGTEATAP